MMSKNPRRDDSSAAMTASLVSVTSLARSVSAKTAASSWKGVRNSWVPAARIRSRSRGSGREATRASEASAGTHRCSFRAVSSSCLAAACQATAASTAGVSARCRTASSRFRASALDRPRRRRTGLPRWCRVRWNHLRRTSSVEASALATVRVPEGCSAVSSVSVTVTLQYRPDHLTGGLQAIMAAEGTGRFSHPALCRTPSRQPPAAWDPGRRHLGDHPSPPSIPVAPQTAVSLRAHMKNRLLGRSGPPARRPNRYDPGERVYLTIRTGQASSAGPDHRA
jgi:hypothetical protein